MSRQADVDGLVTYLRDLVGDSVRSCVEYTPESSTIHYLREDITVDAGQARLARIERLYHASRLAATPEVEDSDLGPLHASVHLFEGALVLHLLDGSGRVFGVSLVPSAVADIESLLAGCFEALYGAVPEGLSVFEGVPSDGTD